MIICTRRKKHNKKILSRIDSISVWFQFLFSLDSVSLQNDKYRFIRSKGLLSVLFDSALSRQFFSFPSLARTPPRDDIIESQENITRRANSGNEQTK